MMSQRSWGRTSLKVIVFLLYGFLLAPILIIVLAAFNAGEYLTFPPQGFSLRWFEKFFNSGPFVRSFLFSLKLAIYTTVIAVVLGTGAALFVIRNAPAKVKDFLRLLMVAPLQLPSILTGIALLLFYYMVGIGTRGITGLLIGHVLVCLPYVFMNVSAVLIGFDRSLEEAANLLGANPYTVFRRITLPLIKGGVISGAVFSFITSFDQFPISLMLSGVGTSTLPIQLFDYLRFSFDPTAAAVSTISVVMTVVLVWLTERLVGLESLYWGGSK
jgi:putative spermidine/putrescine transport system permease protein